MERETITEIIAQISTGCSLGQACSRLRMVVTHLVELAGDPGDDYIRTAAGVLGKLHHPEDGPAALATAFRRGDM